MGTPAAIGRQNTGTPWKGTYVSYDGDPEGVGRAMRDLFQACNGDLIVAWDIITSAPLGWRHFLREAYEADDVDQANWIGTERFYGDLLREDDPFVGGNTCYVYVVDVDSRTIALLEPDGTEVDRTPIAPDGLFRDLGSDASEVDTARPCHLWADRGLDIMVEGGRVRFHIAQVLAVLRNVELDRESTPPDLSRWEWRAARRVRLDEIPEPNAAEFDSYHAEWLQLTKPERSAPATPDKVARWRLCTPGEWYVPAAECILLSAFGPQKWRDAWTEGTHDGLEIRLR
ncbi:MAG: hypothetical protein HN348_28150 [Proteobacteria bacterium]|nr:hypothetical protein [Pseudomonadota bacterium]